MVFKKIFSFVLVFLFFCGLVVCVSGCGKVNENNQSCESGRISVVTTIFPLFDFAKQVAGDSLKLKMLMQPGVDTHSFEPSAETIRLIENCNVLIYLGNDVDLWVEKVLNSIDESKKNKIRIINIVQSLKQNLNNFDPHLWTSFQNVIEISQILKSNFAIVDPGNSLSYSENADLFGAKLSSLKSRFEQVVGNGKRRVLAFADKFPFKNFVDELNLMVKTPYVNCSSKSEALSSKVSDLVDFVKKNQIPVVLRTDFGEPGLAEAVAAETKAKIKVFHDCHTVSAKDFSEGKTYLDFMEQNLETLKEALN